MLSPCSPSYLTAHSDQDEKSIREQEDLLESENILVLAIFLAPLIWVILILALGVLVGLFFGIGSIFWYGPLNILQASESLEKWSPLIIWGSVLALVIAGYLWGERTAALVFLTIYCSIAVLWAITNPK